MQAKLLRALQEGELERIGEERTRKVNVRIIAATNRDLRSEAEAGRNFTVPLRLFLQESFPGILRCATGAFQVSLRNSS